MKIFKDKLAFVAYDGTNQAEAIAVNYSDGDKYCNVNIFYVSVQQSVGLQKLNVSVNHATEVIGESKEYCSITNIEKLDDVHRLKETA